MMYQSKLEDYSGFKFDNFHLVDPLKYAGLRHDNGAKATITAPNVIFNAKGKPASIRKIGKDNFNFYGKSKIHKQKNN